MKTEKRNISIKDNFLKVDYNKVTLDNGIRIVSETINYAESFSFGITINTGSRDDYQGKEGLSHYIEHAVFRQSKNRTGKQIAYQFESLGAYTNAFTTKEVTCYYVRALNKHIDKCLELLFDLVFNPVFNEKEVDKERKVIIEEIKSYEDDPEELIFDYSDRLIFADNSLAEPIAGSVKSVKNINSNDLIDFHRENYIAKNIVISYAGNLESDELINKIYNYTQQIYNKPLTNQRKAPIYYGNNTIEIEKQFQQSHFTLSLLTEGYNGENRYALTALNVMLGEGMSSRLYQALREKNSLAYVVYSSLTQYSDCGSLIIYLATDKKKINKVDNIIKSEFKKLQEKNIPTTELNRIKEQLKSSTIMALESYSTRMQSLAKSELLLGNYEDIESTMNEIDNISIEQIKNISEKILTYDNWSKVIFY